MPFETEAKSLLYVDFVRRKELENVPFDVIVNGMGNGSYPYYDPVELLVNGKVTKVI